jgi:hypothetical protein
MINSVVQAKKQHLILVLMKTLPTAVNMMGLVLSAEHPKRVKKLFSF